MVHGWSMNLEVWREFAEALATQYRVTCLDLPGHGRSEPMDDYSLESVATALLQAAPAKAHWLGWSLGATLALYIAVHRPERVQRLLLIGGSARFIADQNWPCGMNSKLLQSSMVNLQQDYRAALMGFMALQTFGLEDARYILQGMRKRLANTMPPDQGALQGGLEILMQTDLRPCLHEIGRSGLLLLGNKDHLVSVETGAAMQALWPELQVEVIDGAGHVPFLSHSRQTIACILAFLQGGHSTPDKQQAGRSFARAATGYDSVAGLQRAVGERLLSELNVSAMSHKLILDIGAGTGFCTERLTAIAEDARVIAVDFAFDMLHYARTHRQLSANTQWLCADAELLPVVEASVDSIISNLALQWCPQLETVLTGFRRVLRAGGQLHFTSFTEQTLQELRMAWAKADSYVHVNDFVSLTDIKSALKYAGFSDVSIKTETRKVYYPQVLNLMGELKALGAHNVNHGRARHLTGKSTFQRMLTAYESVKEQAGYPATFDIVYVSARIKL